MLSRTLLLLAAFLSLSQGTPARIEKVRALEATAATNEAVTTGINNNKFMETNHRKLDSDGDGDGDGDGDRRSRRQLQNNQVFKIGPETCKRDYVDIVNQGCNRDPPRSDREGIVCSGAGTGCEAYCAFGIGPNACARCGDKQKGKMAIIAGKTCPSNDVKIINNKCNRGDPDFDKEGDVCAAPNTRNEGYCSFGIGPKACARCERSC